MNLWIVGIALYLALGLLIFPLSKRFPRWLGPSRELMGVAAESIVFEPIVGFFIWVFWPLVIIMGLFLVGTSLEVPIKPSSDSEPSQLDLVGSTGVSLTEMKPSGKVDVDGKPYNATCINKFIPKGRSVRILNSQGLILIVEEAVNQAE